MGKHARMDTRPYACMDVRVQDTGNHALADCMGVCARARVCVGARVHTYVTCVHTVCACTHIRPYRKCLRMCMCACMRVCGPRVCTGLMHACVWATTRRRPRPGRPARPGSVSLALLVVGSVPRRALAPVAEGAQHRPSTGDRVAGPSILPCGRMSVCRGAGLPHEPLSRLPPLLLLAPLFLLVSPQHVLLHSARLVHAPTPSHTRASSVRCGWSRVGHPSRVWGALVAARAAAG
jgi:hypothetical protein